MTLFNGRDVTLPWLTQFNQLDAENPQELDAFLTRLEEAQKEKNSSELPPFHQVVKSTGHAQPNPWPHDSPAWEQLGRRRAACEELSDLTKTLQEVLHAALPPAAPRGGARPGKIKRVPGEKLNKWLLLYAPIPNFLDFSMREEMLIEHLVFSGFIGRGPLGGHCGGIIFEVISDLYYRVLPQKLLSVCAECKSIHVRSAWKEIHLFCSYRCAARNGIRRRRRARGAVARVPHIFA